LKAKTIHAPVALWTRRRWDEDRGIGGSGGKGRWFGPKTTRGVGTALGLAAGTGLAAVRVVTGSCDPFATVPAKATPLVRTSVSVANPANIRVRVIIRNLPKNPFLGPGRGEVRR
jgi:hypothetical protein